MLNLAHRHLKIFFRQKSTVFFSFLSVLIVIGLYVIFLGDLMTRGYEGTQGLENLMRHWIIAGVVSVASVTTTMGAFSIMVEDRDRHNDKDFISAPISRAQVLGGYLISAYCIGVILSILTFALGEAYIVFDGGSLLPLSDMLKVLGTILISVMASSAMLFFLITFVKTSSAFSTASTLIGTLIGFLTGIYVPIGSLPTTVQWVVKLFPISHAGALLRQWMLEPLIPSVFSGAPSQAIEAFKLETGVTFAYGDVLATQTLHFGVLGLTTVVFFALSWYRISRKMV